MNTISDFEDILFLLEKHQVNYLIVGGMAFIFHAKPRFTKDMDIWVAPEANNVEQTNTALNEFGSPFLLTLPVDTDEILQLGVAPDRIDFLLDLPGVLFDEAWEKRVRSSYGKVSTNWIDIDSLIKVKQAIDVPRHQEDARILLQVKERS